MVAIAAVSRSCAGPNDIWDRLQPSSLRSTASTRVPCSRRRGGDQRGLTRMVPGRDRASVAASDRVASCHHRCFNDPQPDARKCQQVSPSIVARRSVRSDPLLNAFALYDLRRLSRSCCTS